MAKVTPRLAAPFLALLIPLSLYGGALIAQYGFGLYPCDMCYWQRWPHQAALILAAAALLLRGHFRAMQALTLLAALAIAVSGALGIYHAGVEYGFWAGPACSGGARGPVSLDDLMAAPMIACDKPQWTMAGISLAGFNAIFSLGGAGILFWLLRQGRAARG